MGMAVGRYKYVLASAHQKLGGKWDYACICKLVFLENCLGTCLGTVRMGCQARVNCGVGRGRGAHFVLPCVPEKSWWGELVQQNIFILPGVADGPLNGGEGFHSAGGCC